MQKEFALSLYIRFKKPRNTYRICILAWLLLLLFSVCFLLIQKPSVSILWQLIVIALVILAARLNLKQLHQSFIKHQAIFWQNNCWYIQSDNYKTAICIGANTRVLPYWILLEVKPVDGNILSKTTLFLPKDAMNDKDYRDLCRTLRFIEQDTDSSLI